MNLILIDKIINELTDEINERRVIIFFLGCQTVLIEQCNNIDIEKYVEFFCKKISETTNYYLIINFLNLLTQNIIDPKIKENIAKKNIIVNLNACVYNLNNLLNKNSIYLITNRIQACDYNYISNISYKLLLENVKNNPIKHFNIERLVVGWTNSQFKEYAIEQAKHYNYYKPCTYKARDEFIDVVIISRHFYGTKPSGQLLNMFLNYSNNDKKIRYTLIQLGNFNNDEVHNNLKKHAYKFFCFKYKEDCIYYLKLFKPDIIVEVMGLMNDHLLDIISLKLAPIQISWLAYPGTLGMEAIDYIIADKYVIPETQKQYYVENVITLPECYQINDDTINITEFNCKKHDELKKQYTIIGFMNHTYKVDLKTLDIWCRAFLRCNNSKIMLLNMNKESINNIIYYMKIKYNIDSSNIIISPTIEKKKHLSRIQKYTDFCIDSVICNGHTTTTDILLAGIPLLTMTTPTFSGQVSESLINNINCNELISYNEDDYISNIVKMANDKDYREKITDKVRYSVRKYNSLNTRRYCQHFTSALHIAYENYNNKKSFNVPLIDEYFTNDVCIDNEYIFNINNIYTTIKIMFGNELELLLYKQEMWKNKVLSTHKFDIYNTKLEFKLIKTDNSVNIYLNNVLIDCINNFKQIKSNNDFVL